jgi:hypothetical protein
MPTRIVARWSDWSGDSTEHLVLMGGADGWIADAVVVSAAHESFASRYRVTCDPGWRVRHAEVALVGADQRICLVCDGNGHWNDDQGRPLRDLDGAADIDLSISPFTNTLPIRRLGLRPGRSVDIKVVYVRVPEMSVTVDLQRYTCLDEGKRYRYESLDTDFMREIEVDRHGLVVTYPDLFRRSL